MTIDIKGVIKAVHGTEVISEKFKKRCLILTVKEAITQDLCIEFKQDKTNLLNGFKEGMTVNVGVNVESREYKGKYFTSLSGWKINMFGGDVNRQPSKQNQADDDLPF